MKYLILGSTSFAGASLIDYLLHQEQTVIGVSRSPLPHPVMQPFYKNNHIANFEFYQYDINKNLSEIISLIKTTKPNVIIDFAGQGMVAESWSNPAQWYQTNIVAKVQLHQFLKDCDFLEKYIRISTPEIYGNYNGVLQEELTPNPSTPYAVSHAAIDMSLNAFYQQYQFPVVLARFANFYGPCQQLYRIIPRTMIYALLGKKLLLQGGGITERMFIFANDISLGINKIIDSGELGQVYHFSTGPCISIRHLVEKICDMLNLPFESCVEIAGERPGKDFKYEMDSSKSEHQLNWKPVYSLEKGLEETLKWVKDHFEVLKTLTLNYVHKA